MGRKGKYNQKNQQQDNPKKKNFVITEQHLMDKTHMEQVQYFPYLPADSLYPPFIFSEEQEHLLRTILKQLNYVLYLDFKNFWATILYNPSFKTCIHSCIRFFNRRWLNQYINLTPEEAVKFELLPEQYSVLKDTSAFQYIQHLARIVLLILYRIMHFQQENLQLSNLYHLKTQIVGKYILDVPRLIEIIQVYGSTNEDIVKIIVKQWTNLSTSLYGDFVGEIIEPMVAKLNKSLGMVKKTTDREQFGIQYNYKRTNVNEPSPGEQQLTKKIKLLMQIISFYQTLKNIYQFFPSAWGEYTRFNMQIHTISQNIFIQIEQAYKIWNTHNQSDKIYALMNRILKYVIDYFVEFLQKCEGMFVQKNVKSNYKEAYMKCLDRMLEHYGRRQSLGKKASTGKKYMDMYRQILKVYKIDEFTSKLYIEQVENSTYGLNMEYLVDFKIAIDEQIAKLHGRPVIQPDDRFEQKTQAGREQQRQQPHIQPKKQPKQEQSSQPTKPIQQEVQLDALQVMISKKHRQDNYYQKLYKNYRTKITIEYEDQYDDLVDYEKRPMFEDNDKEEQDSSDASSQYDPEIQQLHLVKSNSNVERARGIGAAHKAHEKYDRKNKVKFVPMREAEAQSIINKQSNKYTSPNMQKQKPTYVAKDQKAKVQQKPKFNQKGSTDSKNKQYNDQECYQECRQKNKQQKQERQRKQQQSRKQDQNTQNDYKYDDEDNDDERQDQKRDTGQRGGYRGGRGRGGNSNNYNNNNNKKPKGSNTNKKKYEPKV